MQNNINPNQENILSKVIIEPIVTEEATAGIEKNKYIFKISARATKLQVKMAIEKIYKVKVEKVNTISIPKKVRVRGRVAGWKSGYRKAVVTLKEGNKIDVFEGK
ncbi:MAG TPA: 50S ribosomal protein L23 [Candidatus Moranbacteria bacterium]|nr:50S ribosomal protein L23 [Candidatus Moranbacteria bacterium]HAT74754.1 50S ribosomal protein L23 [Candidatus Moranbacteria bacterium]